MVNPTLSQTNSKLVLDSNLTLLLSSGKKINITKAQFNKLIEEIKFVDLSKNLQENPVL